jgi:IclR family pca regulon transcriptional regulator
VRVPTKRIMTVAISVGTRFPAWATSLGRVLLAGLSPEELDAHLAATELTPLTKRTITNLTRLRTVIDQVASQGFATTDQELEDGLRSAAAPIRNRVGTVIAAINVSAHATRVTMDQLRRDLVPEVLKTARRIEDDLAASDGPFRR